MKAASYTVTGSATALAGIERMEVSTDGGITWNFATGKENWTYEWTIPGDGTYTIKSRVIAVDDTIESPGAGHAVTIDSSLPTTSGVMTSDETWSDEVAITGDVTVPEECTLTIEPGAVIKFLALSDDTGTGNDTSRSELIINGALIAEGTDTSLILFTSSAATPARNDWVGIRASSSEALTLRHCTVEYAGHGIEYRGTGGNTSVAIEESIIRETSGDGIAIYSEAGVVRTVSLTGNEVYANDGIGIRVYATGSNTVFTNTVTGNSVYDNGSYGIYFDTRSSAKTTSTVSGNEIYNNVTYGLYSYGYNSAQASADISGNTIHDSGIGIYILNSSSSSPFLSIADNTIYNSSEGIYCFTQNGGSSMSPLIEGNNIYNNTGNGIYVYGYRYQSFNNPTIRHNTVTNNSIDGIRVYRLGGTVLPVITLNEVTGNIGRGLSIQSSGSAAIVQNTVTGNGEEGVYINSVEVANVNFNNIAENSGAYEIYNNSVSAVDARYNWWGGSPTAQMNEGDNPKNITKVYDIYDNSAKGGVDYSQWLTQAEMITIDPVSWIKDPVDGLMMKAASYTITGSATALAGIERVEVSTDGGITWNFATGKENWTYEWTIPRDGTYTIKSRVIAVDDTIESPGPGHAVTIDRMETTLAGTIESDETWSGEVSLEGDITVPAGVTITILPGTIVTFPAFFDTTYSGENSSQSELIVNGTLLADGTEGEPILLTSDAPWNSGKGDWLGIRVNGNLRLKNVVVEYATYGIKFVGDENTDEIYIQDCAIRHNSGHGIDVYVDSDADISAFIDSSAISDNDGNGISCRAYTGNTTLNISICNNTVSDNGETGIYCFADGGSGDPAIIGTICNNTVFGHTSHSIYFYTYHGARSELTIDNNTAHHSGIGIYAYYNRASSASTLDVTNNTAHTAIEGIKIYTYDSSLSPLILNNAVHDHVLNGITCSYGGADTYDMVPRIEGNQVFNNAGNGLYLKATEQVIVFNNGLYGNYSFDLYNDSAFDINARSNWWGVNTTNQINSGINPRNISTIFDSFDDSFKGTVDYADWLSLYDIPEDPTLDPVTSHTDLDTQTLSGTKGVDASIILNGTEVVPADEETTWSYEMPLYEGKNSITLYSRTTAGMASGVVISSITLDTTAPYIYSSVPADGAFVSRAVEFVDITLIEEGTKIDAEATLALAMLKDDSETQIPGQWSIDYNHVVFLPDQPLEVGTYIATLHPTDMPLGNTRTSSIMFTVDLTAPVVPTLNDILSPTTTTPQTISGGKDTGTSIWLDNSRIVPGDDLTEWSYNLSLLEGKNIYKLYARDEADNRSDEIIFTVILDRAPPVLQGSEPANWAFVKECPASLTLFFTDITTSLAEEPTLATAIVRDSSSQEISGIWELQVPNTIVFTPTIPFDENTYTASVQAHDLAGNTTSSTISFTYDGTPPLPPTLEPVQSPTIFSVQTLSGTKEANSSVWLNGTEVVAINADTAWFYQITLIEGENPLELYSKDTAGNQSDSVFAAIIYDEIAPLPVSNLTANGSGIGTTVTLDWTGYDEQIHGDIDYYRVYAEDHLFTQVAEMEPIDIVSAGTFTYTADNLVKETPYYFAVVAVDTKGNALSSVTPLSAVPTDKVASEDVTNLQVQCFDTELIFTWDHSANTYGDLAGYKAYFNNSTEAVLLTSSQTSYEQTGLNSATAYPFKVSAYDTDGNESIGIFITGVTLLANPANVSVTPYSGYIDIVWDGVAPSQLVKHHSVYVNETDFSTVQGMAPRHTATGTSAKIAGLTNNKMYYFAVTSVNLSEGETKGVSAVSATPVPDTEGPEIYDVKLDDAVFSNGSVLNSSGTFTLNVTDPASLSRVEFYIDGVLYHTDSNGSNHYSCFLNIAPLEDGSHTLTINAYDTLGNSTSLTYNLVVALDPPAAPFISTPSNGTVTNNSMITVSGSGEKDTEIILYNNGAEAGAPTPVNANGNFSIQLTLTEGENLIQAASRNRAGTGPKSAEVLVTLDTNIPQSPTHLSAEAKASGLIRLAWQKPLEASAKGYHLYRAATNFNSREEATQINSNLITGTSFDDLTPEDGTWYYRVSIVDTADNESELSDEAFAQSDSTLPRADSIQYTPTGQYDQATGRTAPGLVDVLLTVSEPLQTTPFLSITPESGVPISVELTKSADLEYTGFFVISDTTLTGTAYAVFSGRDMVGNRGTEIDSGGSIEIDTNGPAVIEIAIQPADPVRNDQTNPVFVTSTIGLNEVMKEGKTPQLSYLLSAEGRSATAIEFLTLISAQPGHAQTWQGAFQLPDDAGLAEVETLEFIYSGVDDLDNVSADILCANLFQVYQSDLPPLAPPQGLTGQSLPGGKISLSWNEVEGAVGYQLYRQAPDEVELTAYERLDTVLEFMDEPFSDGLYIYAIASIRQENEQKSISGMSSSVEVASDSVSPGAPQNLILDLVGQGIKAEWEAPSYTEPVTYSLYRANLPEITSVEGLTPVVTGITETIAIDAHPSHTDHSYVVTAVDNVGNESLLSNSFYLNFDLLSVSSLSVLQQNDDPPIVSWTHPGGSIAGYDIYLGHEDQRVKLNQNLLTGLSYRDTGYAGDERRYTVIAVDNNDQESLGRSITLPVLRATLMEGSQIKRGVMNRLEYGVENDSSATVDNVQLKVDVDSHGHTSKPFSIDAGALKVIPVTVGGYEDLLDLASLTTTIEITPNAGEKVKIVRGFEIEIGNGMLVLQLLNEEFLRGGTGKVQFTLENTCEEEIEIVTATDSGSSPSNEITFYLMDPDGNVLSSKAFKQNLGEGIVTLANGKTVARIPAGKVFTSEFLELSVPLTSPDQLTIQLDIVQLHFHLGRPDQTSMEGLGTTHEISLVDTAYYGEVLGITPESSNGDQDIRITGQAVERDTDFSLPNVPLDLVVSVSGFDRSYDVFTDDQGSFSFTFTPLPGESGLYKVRAVHPDLLDRPIQGEFVINRLSITPATINLSIPRNYEKDIGIRVTAGEGTEVNNLRLVYDELDQPGGAFPDGVHVTLGSSVSLLGSNQGDSLDFNIWADNSAENTGKIVLKVKSDETGEDSWGSVIVNTHFSDAQPVLYFMPDHVETGVTFDETVTETIILENRGLSDLNDVSLALVSQDGTPAPNWVCLNSVANQGVISVGENREIGISFNPTSTVGEGNHSFYLRVTSSKYQTTDIGLLVSVTQSGVGSLLFKVADIYTGTVDQSNEIIQGLSGARIKVQNEQVLTIEETKTTDGVGEALFADLPAGRYKCRITANNHQEYIGRLWIKPGTTISEEVFLGYNLVTVEWEVTETTIEDKYEIILNATYETDVPAAVLIAEPASLTLPEMQAGDVYNGEFTLTNYGLIRADQIEFLLPQDDQNFRYELLAGLPNSLGAKERITIAYRVTCLSALNQEEDGGGSGGGCRHIRHVYKFHTDMYV